MSGNKLHFLPRLLFFKYMSSLFFTTNLPDGNSQFLFAFSFYWLHKQYLLAQYSLSCNLIKSLIVLCVLIRCFRNSLIGCCAILVVEPQGLIYANELNQLYSSHVSYVCVCTVCIDMNIRVTMRLDIYTVYVRFTFFKLRKLQSKK